MPHITIWPRPDDEPTATLISGEIGILNLASELQLYFAAGRGDPAHYLTTLGDACHKLAHEFPVDRP